MCTQMSTPWCLELQLNSHVSTHIFHRPPQALCLQHNKRRARRNLLRSYARTWGRSVSLMAREFCQELEPRYHIPKIPVQVIMSRCISLSSCYWHNAQIRMVWTYVFILAWIFKRSNYVHQNRGSSHFYCSHREEDWVNIWWDTISSFQAFFERDKINELFDWKTKTWPEIFCPRNEPSKQVRLDLKPNVRLSHLV